MVDWLVDWAHWRPDKEDDDPSSDDSDFGEEHGGANKKNNGLDKDDEKDSQPAAHISRLVHGILQSPEAIRDRIAPCISGKQAPEQHKPPLVVLISNINEYFTNDMAQPTLEYLQSVLKMGITRLGKHIIIATDAAPPSPPPLSDCDCSQCQRKINPDTRKFLSSAAICQICPTRSQKLEYLFEDANRRDRLDMNIRAIPEKLKVLVPAAESALLLPYAHWELPTGTEAGDLLRKRVLSSDEQTKIAGRLSKDLSVDHLIISIKGIERRSRIEKRWKNPDEQKIKVPLHALQAVEQIKENTDKFKLENRLLHCIVDPSRYSMWSCSSAANQW